MKFIAVLIDNRMQYNELLFIGFVLKNGGFLLK